MVERSGSGGGERRKAFQTSASECSLELLVCQHKIATTKKHALKYAAILGGIRLIDGIATVNYTTNQILIFITYEISIQFMH